MVLSKIKNIIYSMVFCLVLISAYPLAVYGISKDYCILPQKEWSICSPIIHKDNRVAQMQQLRYHSPFDYVRELGEKADYAWAHSKHNEEVIAQFQEIFSPVTKDVLIDLIDQILNDDDLLQDVTKASYRNVTGFLKVVLIQGGENSWKIRLHVWQAGEQKEFPHNHKWDFYSRIITGYLLQEIYEPIIDEERCLNPFSVREPISLMPVEEDGKLPCPCRDNYTLAQKGADAKTISLQVVSKNILGIGESYCMPHNLIHTITPGRGAISFVFTSRKKSDNSEVYVPLHQVDTDLDRYAPSVTTDELRQELLKLRKALVSLHMQEKYLPELVDLQHHYYHMNNNDPILHIPLWREGIHTAQNRQIVKQLSCDQLQQFKVSANELGQLLIDNVLFDSDNDYLFTLIDGVMYATPKDFHHHAYEILCHTSFSDYGPVESAGVLRCDEKGYVTVLEAYSGHYAPTVANMEIAKAHLVAIGANTDKVVLTTYKDRMITQ